MEEEPYLREVFVGITRAKTRLRIHHGPGAFLPHAQLAGLAFVECSDETRLWPPAEVLQMSLGHDGLFLDYFISRQRLIEKLHSGQKLIPRDFELFCRTEGGGEASVARFSKKAREDIASILAGGYVMSEASVRVMVYWRKKDSDADTLILLPDLVFRRVIPGDACTSLSAHIRMDPAPMRVDTVPASFGRRPPAPPSSLRNA